MNRNSDSADHQIHLYLDNELDAEEIEQLFSTMENDEVLRARVCELQHLKHLTKNAYPLESFIPTDKHRGQGRSHRLLQSVAMTALLFFGLVTGWLGEQWWATRNLESALEVSAVTLPTVSRDPHKVLLHIDSQKTAKLSTVLDKAETLLREYDQNNVQVEIIANAEGLNLFRTGAKPYQQRLSQLASRYHNLRLLACAKAVARYEARGSKLQLIPEVHIGPTAIDHIIHRLQQGWTYTRI